MTELAVNGPSSGALALRSDQHQFNDQQSAALRQLGLGDVPTGDLAVFLHVAQRTGLDPFSRQIHMIARWDSQSNSNKYTIQTGIDGLRIIADRRPEYRGQVGPQWCGDDGQWREFWVGSEPPVAARVGVLREGWNEAAWGVAMFREYAQTKRNGDLTQMWASKGALMLAKCAEAAALRKAFPHDMAGVVTPEEMERDDNARTSPAAVARDAAPVTTAELTGQTPAPGDRRMSAAQQGKLFALLREADIEDRWAWASGILGRDVSSYGHLAEADASTLIDRLETGLAALDGEVQP